MAADGKRNLGISRHGYDIELQEYLRFAPDGLRMSNDCVKTSQTNNE